MVGAIVGALVGPVGNIVGLAVVGSAVGGILQCLFLQALQAPPFPMIVLQHFVSHVSWASDPSGNPSPTLHVERSSVHRISFEGNDVGEADGELLGLALGVNVGSGVHFFDTQTQ